MSELGFVFSHPILIIEYVSNKLGIFLAAESEAKFVSTLSEMARDIKNKRDISDLHNFVDKFPQIYCHYKFLLT